MNKQEEKKFDNLCKSIFETFGCEGIPTDELIDWIDKHDKREKERLIEEISNDVKMISFGKFQREYKIIYKEAYNDFISRMWEILGSKK